MNVCSVLRRSSGSLWRGAKVSPFGSAARNFSFACSPAAARRYWRPGKRCGYPRGDLPQGCITVSIGAATTEAENAPRLEDLLSRADKALYEAKHEGRNCVAAYI